MTATEKQCNYLNALQSRALKYLNKLNEQPGFTVRDWLDERRFGMTTTDASIKICAFKTLIASLQTKCILFNIGI